MPKFCTDGLGGERVIYVLWIDDRPSSQKEKWMWPKQEEASFFLALDKLQREAVKSPTPPSFFSCGWYTQTYREQKATITIYSQVEGPKEKQLAERAQGKRHQGFPVVSVDIPCGSSLLLDASSVQDS